MSCILFSFGCTKSSTDKTDASLSEAQTSQTANNTEGQTSTESSSASSLPTTTTAAATTTTAEQITADIQKMITEADKYY
ncbi:MAG: hypothetical protein WCJ54_01120, partial [Actinomycetota bacterium]